jgi:hypothetical protein
MIASIYFFRETHIVFRNSGNHPPPSTSHVDGTDEHINLVHSKRSE